MTTYEMLYAAVDAAVQDNRTDLTVADRMEIDSRPGVPFLHYARRYGTTLIFFPIASDQQNWPAKGFERQQTYGLANREKILDYNLQMARRFANDGAVRLTHHFDGTHLHRISRVRAKYVADEYAAQITADWASGQGAIV
jgi:hypothetical protein